MFEEDILTWDGLQQLEAELNHLRSVKRRQVVLKIKESLGFGDSWENSEYTEAKNEQAFIEGKINSLETLLRKAKIIHQFSNNPQKVEVGYWVYILDLQTNEESCYRIVGSCEANPGENKISHRSPVAKALLGKSKGDEVQVSAPGGAFCFKILTISAQPD